MHVYFKTLPIVCLTTAGDSPRIYDNLQAGNYTVTVRATCPGQRQRPRKSVDFMIGGRRN